MSSSPIGRRDVLWLLPVAGLGLLGGVAQADQPLLDETDASALAVDYKTDAAKVDGKKFPKFAKSQTCANCGLYAGLPNDSTGGCQLFYGYDVTAKGWCSSWEQKPR
jgi:hypothetical protein